MTNEVTGSTDTNRPAESSHTNVTEDEDQPSQKPQVHDATQIEGVVAVLGDREVLKSLGGEAAVLIPQSGRAEPTQTYVPMESEDFEASKRSVAHIPTKEQATAESVASPATATPQATMVFDEHVPQLTPTQEQSTVQPVSTPLLEISTQVPSVPASSSFLDIFNFHLPPPPEYLAAWPELDEDD